MTKITTEEVRHVANLARLRVSDDEVQTFTSQLEGLLEHFSAISSIDTAGIKPTSHPIEIKPSLTQEQVLSNAPKMEDSRFAVPQILGDSE